MQQPVKRFILAVAAAIALSDPALGAPDESASTEHVSAELIAAVSSIRPGAIFWVGVRLSHARDWHTYWLNPGDSGLATSIAWDLPEGFSAGEIHWPYPQWIEALDMVSFGYEDQATLLVRITAPDNQRWVGSDVELAAEVSWLECRDICIPGRARVSLTLPMRPADSAPPPDEHKVLGDALARLPVDAEGWSAQGVVHGELLELEFIPPSRSPHSADAVRYFPEQEFLLRYDSGLPIAFENDRYRAIAPLDPARTGMPDHLGIVLVRDSGWGPDGAPTAIRLEAPIRTTSEAVGAVDPGGGFGLLHALAIAFLGGVILNAMPCVFPVISLKILSFMELAKSDPAVIRLHGWLFAAGVLLSFWVLAGALLVLKAASPSVGWGFQLSNPGFVVAMGVLFLLLSLNLFGVFELGTSLTGIGAVEEGRAGFGGTLLSGALATVVATPCTGPFMGAAVGFALTQPAAVGMAVFTALGVGMAAPYLVLSHVPQGLKRLPRPGPWMESLKQVMGFVLLAFVLYLTWLYAELRGTAGLSQWMVGLLLAAVGAWVFGRWGSMARPPLSRRLAAAAAIVLVCSGGAVAATPPRTLDWEPFSPERVAALRERGKPFFIDFTASWCVTCQYNKRLVLNTDEVQRAFRERDVALIQADWSEQPEAITRALAEFGRSGVPLYLLYGSEPGAAPRILPELLTKGIVLDALEDLP